MMVVQGERLALRHLTLADADWIRDLLNDPDFIRHIGDRQVRTREEAERYLTTGPLASYAAHGFGLNAATLGPDRPPLGIPGEVRRDTLPDPDRGDGLLPVYRAHGR